MRAEERERARVARDLHDEAGQVLAALRLRLEAARAVIDHDPARDDVIRAIELVELAGAGLRRTIAGLRPPPLEALGLIGAVEAFCHGFALDARLIVRVRHHQVPELDTMREVCVYRCLQEMLANVARHAAATRVDVVVASVDRGRHVALQVRDDGVGIDEGRGRGLGLVGMRERVELLGGWLTTIRTDGGTTVTAVVPARPVR